MSVAASRAKDVGVFAPWLATAAALFFLFFVIRWALRIERGPFGFAAHYFPRLCAASEGPRATDVAPAWVDGIVAANHKLGMREPKSAIVIDDLLGGSIEVGRVWRHDRILAIARCPGVLVAKGLDCGTVVAEIGSMMQGRRRLAKVATLRSTGAWHAPIRVWFDREGDCGAGIDEAVERLLRKVFSIGMRRGLSAIEIHAGEVFLVFDGHGKSRLEPRHIAAICDALDVGGETVERDA